MGDSIKESGLIIIWREWEFIPGLMEENMKENIKMIRNMDMEYIFGRTRENIRDGGIRGSSMV